MAWANAQDSQGWKRPWGLWGVGLRLKEQKAPRHAPLPWSQRAGDLSWELSRLPVPEWAGQSPSAPLPLLWSGRAPPACLSLSPWPPSYAPRTHMAWLGLWRWDTSLGAQQAPWPEWARRLPSALLPLFLESPSHLLLLMSPASEARILSGLHFSSPLSPPTSYQFTLRFLLFPWASEFPHQRPSGALVVRRC